MTDEQKAAAMPSATIAYYPNPNATGDLVVVFRRVPETFTLPLFRVLKREDAADAAHN